MQDDLSISQSFVTAVNDELSKFLDGKEQILLCQNLGSQIAERLLLTLPYMIMYESFDVSSGHAVYREFTKYGAFRKEFLVSDYPEFIKRPMHSHNFFEFTIVLSGKLHMSIENKSLFYYPGECCFCNENIHHKEILDTGYSCALLLISNEYLKDILKSDLRYRKDKSIQEPLKMLDLFYQTNQNLSFLSEKKFCDFTIQGNKKPKNCSQPLTRTVEALFSELTDRAPGSSFFVKGYISRIFHLLETDPRYQVQIHTLPLSKTEKLFYDISMLLEKNGGRISHTEMEKQLNYNRDYISRIVKQHTGLTLSEYKKFFLMKEAEHLLAGTSLSVSEICSRLGYTNQTFFNRLFKENSGMTPGQYRQKCTLGQ